MYGCALKSPRPGRCNPFLQIYETGSGDWTKERKTLLEDDPIKLSKASWPEEKKSQLHEQRLHFSYGTYIPICTHSLVNPGRKHSLSIPHPDPDP